MASLRSEIRLVKLTLTNINKLQLIDFSAEMMKYITGTALSHQEAINRYSVDIDHQFFGSYFVKNSSKDQIIGFAVIKDKEKEAEIGYLVMKPYRGRGIATQINKKLIDICCKNLPDRIISAQTDIRNNASIRVLEKSGMRKIKTYEEGGNMICKFSTSS